MHSPFLFEGDYMRCLVALLFLTLFCFSCSSLDNVGRNAGAGTLEELIAKRDSFALLTGALARSARDTLLAPETTRRLAFVLDSLLSTVNGQTRLLATGLRDTLAGAYTREWLLDLERNLLLELNRSASTLRSDLLGDRTRTMVAALREELIGPAAASEVLALRNQVLDSTLQMYLDSMAYRTMAAIGRSYKDNIQPVLDQQLDSQKSWLERNVPIVMWTGAGIIAGLLVLAGFIFMRNRRNRKTLELVTHQIHNIPNREAYDELTHRIQNKSQEMGLEPHLRTILEEQGILNA